MWTRLSRLSSVNFKSLELLAQPTPTSRSRRDLPTGVRSRVLCSVGEFGQQQQVAPPAPELHDAQDVSASRHTITALSSGAGRCGVALLRVSGPQADHVLKSVLPRHKALPEPRRAVVAEIRHPTSREVLDRALLLRFPAPHSFTGEDVAELHVHGGPAVVRAVLEALCSIPGVRLAEAGEFTRRAFELGKVDLTEAEGLADLLSAETEAQRKQALRQSTGAQRHQYESWRGVMVQCLANIEAVIDFGEDEEIAEEVAQQVLPRMQALQKQLQHHLLTDRRSELVRSGMRVAIVGAPNVGKSTILNHLAGRRAAIVSAIPGTTRDAIEVTLEISGYKVIVTDTAGLRETLDPIEAEGVALAQETALQADIVLSVLDCTTLGSPTSRILADPYPSQAAVGQIVGDLGTASILVLNKADALSNDTLQQLLQQLEGPSSGSLSPSSSNAGAQLTIDDALATSTTTEFRRDTGYSVRSEKRAWLVTSGTHASPISPQGQAAQLQGGNAAAVSAAAAETLPPLTAVAAAAAAPSIAKASALEITQRQASSQVVVCSCKTGLNMEALTDALESAVQQIMQQGQESEEGFAITRARHRYHVEQCTEALERYQAAPMELEIAAEELRAAAKSLGRVTGIIDTEDLLDAIFSEFCIGK